MLEALFGFAAPFVPHVIKRGFAYFEEKQDHKHELEMMKLQAELAEKQAAFRTDEIKIEQGVKDRTSARRMVMDRSADILNALAANPKASGRVVGFNGYLAGVANYQRASQRPWATAAVLILFAIGWLTEPGWVWLVLGFLFGGRVADTTFGRA